MRTLGQLDPLVMAGVAVYVGTVYVFWESFRAYFDWSESLAISFIVRGASTPYIRVCVREFAKCAVRATMFCYSGMYQLL